MSSPRCKQRVFRGGSTDPKRRGVIILVTAGLLVVMLAMLALSVDLGYVSTVRAELKRATDAAALAGAGAMIEGSDVAMSEAFTFLARNPIGGQIIYKPDNWRVDSAQWLKEHPDEFKAEFGQWDPLRSPGSDPENDQRFYNDDSQPPSAIQIVASRPNAPLFFSRLFGRNTFSVSAQTIARYQPRDIMLVLDYSRSMNFDSNLQRITDFGESARAAVEANLLKIYQDLGSPAYGNMQFTPQYATVPGTNYAATFRVSYVDVNVSSAKTLKSAVLSTSTGSGGSTKSFTGLSGKTATLYYSGKLVQSVKVTFTDNSTETIAADTTGLLKALGLTNVAYPYPGGSWSEYFNCVKNDGNIINSGYRMKFGFLTFINYLEDYCSTYAETPVLWRVREQPIATVKDASGLFFDFIQQVRTNDRVGFVLYSSSNNTAVVESSLTTDFNAVKTKIQQRQAGHYVGGTNIGAGIAGALAELQQNGRAGAFKMVVLMTDGRANLPSSESTARAYTLDQAAACKSKRYPICTIALGMDADTELLRQVSDATNGAFFQISGSTGVSDYGPALLEAFRRIANARPLQIVK